jgi:hypothetical protein
MFRRIRDWANSIADVVGWVQIISQSGVVVAVGWALIRGWLQGLENTQFILLLIASFFIVLLIITYINKWFKQRATKIIPDLLATMDEKMKRLIEVTEYPKEKIEGFYDDAGELWNIDIPKIRKAYLRNDNAELRKMIRDEIQKIDTHSPYPQTQATQQPLAVVIQHLMQLSGLMKNHKIDIDSIRDDEYKRLEARLITLEKRVKSSKTIKSINVYQLWWRGLTNYSLLEHYAPIDNLPADWLPARAKAMIPNVSFYSKIAMSEYMGYVKDSIYNDKKGHKDEL